MNQPQLGLKVSELRQQKGLTQEQLAERCEVSARTIQRIESGEVDPRAYTLHCLGEVLEFDFGAEDASNENLWLTVLHLSSILCILIIPLLLWSWKRNQSFKIDYLVKITGANKVIFLELKTDDGSRRSKQDWYLERARQVGLPTLLEGLREIYRATTSKRKYRYLLKRLHDMGLILLKDGGGFQIPQAHYDIQIVYLQPNNPEGSEDIISFEDASQIIRQHDDELSVRFAQSLSEWANVKAGGA